MSRFILGDTDGAASWLRKALEEVDVPPHVRRGLRRSSWRGASSPRRTTSSTTAPMRRSSTARCASWVALRRADDATAHARAEALAADLELPSDAHPWDLAGVHVQLGFVALELRDADGAARAAEAVGRLTADAPREVPLVPQGQIILAGALRLRGDLAQAKRTLSVVRDELRAGPATVVWPSGKRRVALEPRVTNERRRCSTPLPPQRSCLPASGGTWTRRRPRPRRRLAAQPVSVIGDPDETCPIPSGGSPSATSGPNDERT